MNRESMNRSFTPEEARKILAVVDAGLSAGLGRAEPGHMCIEAAICYSLGLPHGDDPGCVDSVVRSFKIRLNDSRWSSKKARARGMRALAIAQLGSQNTINGREFSRLVVEQTIRQIVPIALRKAAHLNPRYRLKLEQLALECENEGTPRAADAAAAAATAAYTAAYADASYTAAYYAACYAAAAAAWAATAAADADAAAAAWAAAAAAAAAADAVAWAAAAAAADAVLTRMADIALSALRSLGAPGVALWDEVGSGTR